MKSLHDLETSLAYYNDITKKTCLIPVLDQNTFIRTIIKYLTNVFRFLKSTSSFEPLPSFTVLSDLCTLMF